MDGLDVYLLRKEPHPPSLWLDSDFMFTDCHTSCIIHIDERDDHSKNTVVI